MGDLSHFMKWLHGTVAGDINRRQGREGSFWKGRFQTTLVETGSHLSRCLFYIDMNMVRAKVVQHPEEWFFGGSQELLGHRKRYCIIDREWLVKLLATADIAGFRRWYIQTLDKLCRHKDGNAREAFWSSSPAVGSRPWLERLVGEDMEARHGIRPVKANDDESTYRLVAAQFSRRLLKKWHSTAWSS